MRFRVVKLKTNDKASMSDHFENKAKENWKNKNKLNHESFYNSSSHDLDDTYLNHLCSLVKPNYNIFYSDSKSLLSEVKEKGM